MCASQPATPDSVKSIIEEWPEDPREVAETVIEKYGEPDEATPSRLIWFDNGPWKRSVLRREAVVHKFPREHNDLFEQTIDYGVDPEHYDDLGRFDGSVHVDRTGGELSAMCHGEPANFLAINLAHDVITGQRSVEEAREFYAEAIAKKDAGNPPPYTQEFQFELPEGDQADPDEPAITDEMRERAQQEAGGGAAAGAEAEEE